MVEYIKQYIAKLRSEKGLPAIWIIELQREFSRFDPRDFEPAVQHEVMWLKARLEYLSGTSARHSASDIKADLDQVLHLLDGFRGDGSHGITRSFNFIADLELRNIVERDYFELTVKLFPSGAWKSSVIMAGSILEAILFDQLASAKWTSHALASGKVPNNKGASVPFDDWKLFNLIDVAVDVKLLQKDPADTIHQVLRDYRNFVHPKKEIRSAHACTEAEGMLSLGALNSVCNYLEANP